MPTSIRTLQWFLILLLVTSSIPIAALAPSAGLPSEWVDSDRAMVNKVVLGEMFTATWCDPCVNADAGLDIILDDPAYFDKRFVAIEYHSNDEYSFDEGDNRNDYYRISGLPTIVFDGQDKIVGSQGDPKDNADAFKTAINAQPSQSYLSIDVTASIEDDLGEVIVFVMVEQTLPLANSMLTINTMLVEDEDLLLDSGHILRMTARDMPINGVDVVLWTEGNNATATGSFRVDPSWVREDTALVAWVQNDNTKEVLQAVIGYPKITGSAPHNDPPVYIGGDIDFEMEEDTVANHITVNQLFSDPEGDTLFYDTDGSMHINTSVDQDTTTLRVTPAADWSGTETVYISARDSRNAPVTHPVTVTVSSVNDPPRVINDLTGLEFDEDKSTVTSPISTVFYDPDGDPMSFQIENMVHLKAVKNVDDSLTITPQENWNGYEDLMIKASDGEFETVYEDTVRVRPVNDAPVMTSYFPDDWTEVEEGGGLTLSITASDIEQDPLSYTWEVNGIPSSIKSSTFNYEPAYGDSGQHVILVKVSDGTDIASHVFHITVVEGNRAPSVRISGPLEGQEFEEGDVIVFTSDVSDPDDPPGRFLEYKWTIDGKVVSIDPQFTKKLDEGTHTVTLEVSDGEFEVKDTITVKVKKKGSTGLGLPGFDIVIWLVALTVAVLFVGWKGRRRR